MPPSSATRARTRFPFSAVPRDISSGHNPLGLSRGNIDLSQLTFGNWTADDRVVVVADQVGLAGTPDIIGPNVAATIFGGVNGENLTGGSAGDIIIGKAGNDKITGGGGNDRLYGGNSLPAFGLNGARDVVADFNGDGRADLLQFEPGGLANVLLRPARR